MSGLSRCTRMDGPGVGGGRQTHVCAEGKELSVAGGWGEGAGPRWTRYCLYSQTLTSR